MTMVGKSARRWCVRQKRERRVRLGAPRRQAQVMQIVAVVLLFDLAVAVSHVVSPIVVTSLEMVNARASAE